MLSHLAQSQVSTGMADHSGRVPYITHFGNLVRSGNLESLPGWVDPDASLSAKQRAEALGWKAYIEGTLTDLVVCPPLLHPPSTCPPPPVYCPIQKLPDSILDSMCRSQKAVESYTVLSTSKLPRTRKGTAPGPGFPGEPLHPAENTGDRQVEVIICWIVGSGWAS
jgi:hypothetical protein